MRGRTVTIVSLLIVFAGLIVLIGWLFGIGFLQHIFPQYISIKFNTASGFIITGLALLIIQFQVKRNIAQRKKANNAQTRIMENEERLRALFDNVEGGTCLYDTQLRLIAFNNVFANIGISLVNREPQIGEIAYSFLPPDEQARRHEILKRVLQGSKESLEAQYERNGKTIYFKTTFNPVMVDGKVTAISSYTSDLTSSREAEIEIRKSEANLKAILDTTETAYALLDKNLKVIAFNKMAIKFVGSQYNHTPAKGDQLADYFPADRFPQFLKFTDEVLKGNNINYEVNYPQPNGSVFWFYVRLFPITNDKKEILGLMMELSNVTERKNAEESLKTAYSAIQEHINNIKDMAWKQSHLIRSPLANLKGLTGLLQENPADTEVLNNIKVELQRLDEVIIEMANDAAEQAL